MEERKKHVNLFALLCFAVFMPNAHERYYILFVYYDAQASYVITLAPYFVLTALLAYGLQLKVNNFLFFWIMKLLFGLS